MDIRFRRLRKNTPVPEYKTPGSVAFDLSLVEDVTIEPRSLAMVPTGLVIEVPEGHGLIIASRSSNPKKKGINLANSIGVVDQDYCGPEDEIYLVLQNITDQPVSLSAGDRVAQGLVLPIARGTFVEADALAEQSRGGFGSTGQ